MRIFSLGRQQLFRLCVLCVFFVVGQPSPRFVDGKARSSYQVTARSAIFSNSSRGKRYYGKNVNLKVPPASTTKVMTALLVLEKMSMNAVVTISSNAAAAQPSELGARPGEKFRVRDLLYAILLKSANDASIALAEAVAGSEWEFVKMMNRRARQLGAKHTNFVNSSGLPSAARQYTTAYDMYMIFREALKYNFFRVAIKHKYKSIYSLTGKRYDLRSHNKILFKNWQTKIYGKTGYTRAAKSCFVGYFMRGKDVCIIAVFGCQQRWSDIKYIVSKYGRIPI
jgi:serine-type D-Ala-D-Ala carboxypeptidase (penicillin-binding protein 5/6)